MYQISKVSISINFLEFSILIKVTMIFLKQNKIPQNHSSLEKNDTVLDIEREYDLIQ